MKKKIIAALVSACMVSGILTAAVSAQDTAVVITDRLNIRSLPSLSGEVLGKLTAGEIVIVLEDEEDGWVQIQTQDGEEAYVSAAYLTINGSAYVSDGSQEGYDAFYEEVYNQDEDEAEDSAQTETSAWEGEVLDAQKGVVYGPSGKETYYNLDMSGVIRIMRGLGNTDEYWVRDDGVKMLGDYVMCAANLTVYPRGSLVETSLGTAIVCDTGGFAAANPTQVDIAVTW